MLFEAQVNSQLWLIADLPTLRHTANSIGCARCAGIQVDAPRCLVVSQVVALDANPLLTVDDETALRAWYELQIIALIRGTIKRPDKVAATAVILFKRFFLSHSLLEFNPAVVAACCMFVASKVEDEFISATDLGRAFEPEDVERAAVVEKDLKDFELTLLAGVNYDLRIVPPHRPLRSVNPKAIDFADALLLTDAPLLYSPAVCALAAAIAANTSIAQLRDKFGIDDASLKEASDLAATIRLPSNDALTAAAKPIHRRLKKVALWRDTTKRKRGE